MKRIFPRHPCQKGQTMGQITITGTEPNLKMLRDDLNGDAEFQKVGTVSIDRTESNDSKLRNADLATLIINLAEGVVSTGVYEVIKHAVLAARRRGAISTEGLEESGGKAEDHG
jgi:hypothetical protein